jgi:vancomycin permeability regulator SanA
MHRAQASLARGQRFLRRHWRAAAGLLCLLVLLLAAPMMYTFASTRGQRYSLDKTPIRAVPFHKVTLVFGAGILLNRKPTPYLQERLETAVKLYRAHRTDILLMSGDNSGVSHNEPLVMRDYAIHLGVPAKDVVVDDAGFDTYDSCYRAHALFGLRSAILVSQGYHLPRAMVTCRDIGITNSGVIALHPQRDYTLNYLLREVLSTDKMFVQLIFKPHPRVLGPPLPL